MAERQPRVKKPRIRPLSYRHELKYFLNQIDYEVLHRRLLAAMEQDKNARINGGEYFISIPPGTARCEKSWTA